MLICMTGDACKVTDAYAVDALGLTLFSIPLFLFAILMFLSSINSCYLSIFVYYRPNLRSCSIVILYTMIYLFSSSISCFAFNNVINEFSWHLFYFCRFRSFLSLSEDQYVSSIGPCANL